MEGSRSKNTLKQTSNNQQQVGDQSEQLRVLMRENGELKKELIELKVHQFYYFDDKKLKDLIMEVEELRKEVKKSKTQISELQMQNDFLTRTNVQLKLELEKEIQIRKKD
jgi:FtsZ-binding cell division protein ZapB